MCDTTKVVSASRTLHAVRTGTSELLSADAAALGLTAFLPKPVELSARPQLFAAHCATDPSR